MELSPLALYFILKLDALVVLFGVSAGVVGFVALTCLVGFVLDGDKDGGKGFKLLVGPFVVLLLLAVGMPSTKQMAAILVLPPIVNNERVQEVPAKLLDVLDLSLEKAKDALQDNAAD